jgi:hypothetical protein
LGSARGASTTGPHAGVPAEFEYRLAQFSKKVAMRAVEFDANCKRDLQIVYGHSDDVRICTDGGKKPPPKMGRGRRGAAQAGSVIVAVMMMMMVMVSMVPIVVVMMVVAPIVVAVPAIATMMPVMVAVVHRIGTRTGLLHTHLIRRGRRLGARGRGAQASRDGSRSQKLRQHDNPPGYVSAGMCPAQLALSP